MESPPLPGGNLTAVLFDRLGACLCSLLCPPVGSCSLLRDTPMGAHVALLDHPSPKPIVLALITHLGVADCAVLFTHLIQHMSRPQPKLRTIAIAVCLVATPAATAEFKRAPQADGPDII